jgi:hypothetical protein
MSIADKREPTVDELLADMMMPLLFDRDRTTADEVRALKRGARERMATAAVAVANDNASEEGAG